MGCGDSSVAYRVVCGWSAYEDFDSLTDAGARMGTLLREPQPGSEYVREVRILDMARPGCPVIARGTRPGGTSS